MIEVSFRYDMLPGVNMKTYGEWARKAVATILQQPGVVEFRASRSLLGSPQVRTSTVFQSAADWERFAKGSWLPLEDEFRSFVTNLRVELWGPSPHFPDPLHPKK